MDEQLQQLGRRLAAGARVCVLTGAGISAESGIPTFRDAQSGLWARFRPEDLATPEAFERNPTLVWRWYRQRRAKIARVNPNPGHLALAELETLVQDFTLITQNVDGLHQRAGSVRVIELHGNIERSICHLTRRAVDLEYVRCHAAEPPPSPHHPRGLVRPDVVWFGEALPRDQLERAFAYAQECDVFFAIGTSALVEPAASLPLMARQGGAWLVEVNRQTTPLSALADVHLNGPAGEILPALLAAMRRRGDQLQRL